MKILTQGVAPADRWHKGTCFTCFTEVEFQGHEATRANKGQSDGDTLEVACPVCHDKITCNASTYQAFPYSQKPHATWRDI